ncbi:MAG: TolC family protein [Bacteroidales bacterium]
MNRSIKAILIIWGASHCWLTLPAQELLTLSQAIATGLENNFDIIIRKNDALIAENDNAPGNAGFLPTLNLSAAQGTNISNTYQERATGSVIDIKGATNRTLNAGLQLNWTLFDGFSMFVNKNSLGVLERMSETEARLTIESTVSSIILAYYGIVQQQKLIRVLEDAVALSMDRKFIMESKLSLGSGSELMLLQSTVDLNADSVNLLREMANLERFRADFNRLLSLDPEIRFVPADSLIPGEMLSYKDLLERAKNQNTGLQLARYSLDLDNLYLKNLQSQRYPRLNLNASYGYNQLNSQTGFLEYNRSYGPSFGLSLSYALFDGFNVNRNIKNARIEISSGETMLRSADLGLHNEIYKLFVDYETNRNMVEIEEVNQGVAKRNVDVAYEKYRLGAFSDIELRETQKKYIDAQYQLLLSQYQVKRAEIELLRLSGGMERFLSD